MTHLYKHPEGHVFYRAMKHGRPKISHGEGIYLYDESGKRYLDGSGGPFVVNVGHGRSEVVQAMAQQAQAAAYIHANMFTSSALEEYAAALAEITPLPDSRFFFLSSGSEVIEGALKLARQIQLARGEKQRSRIISRKQSYHGMSLGALAVSGRPSLRAPYADMLPPSIHIDPPYPYRDARSGEELAALLEDAILQTGADHVAGFLAESISGAGLGACIPPEDYWPAIREICNRYGVLLIADEVFVGLGRTGKWWGFQHWDFEPDMIVTSKGSAGGYFPLGFIAAKGSDVQAIYETLGDFNHGSTFSHHAVGAAAGLATLKILHEEKLVENAATMGAILGEKLHEVFANHPLIGDIRGRGLFWTLEIVQDKASKAPFPAEAKMAQNLHYKAFDLGLIVYYAQGCVDGKNGDLIHIGPPLIINEAQVDELVVLLQRVFENEQAQY